MVLRQQLLIARKWARWLLFATVFGGLLGGWLGTLGTPSYVASAQLVVQPAAQPSINDLLLAEQLASSYAIVAQTRDFAQTVVEKLGLSDLPDQLLQHVSTKVDSGTGVLTVSVTGPDPQQVATVANGFAQILQQHVADEMSGGNASTVDTSLAAISSEIARNQARIDQLLALPELSSSQQAELTGLYDRQSNLQSTYAALRPYSSTAVTGRLELLQTAVPPTKPSGLSPLLLTLLSAVATFLLVAAVVFVLEYFDDTIRSPRDVEAIEGMPLLSTLPDGADEGNDLGLRRLVAIAEPTSTSAEAYRTLAVTLGLSSQKDLQSSTSPPRQPRTERRLRRRTSPWPSHNPASGSC